MTHNQLTPIRDGIKSFFKLFFIFSILFEDWGIFIRFLLVGGCLFFVGWRVLQRLRDGFGGLQARKRRDGDEENDKRDFGRAGGG